MLVYCKLYLVINLNLEIEKAKNEFDDKNYERALEILDSLEVEGEYHKLAVMIRIASLMALKRYDDSLSVIDSNIEKFPYSDFLWSRRVECHYFNGDEENAVKSLEELERIVNKDEKHALVFLAEEFELLDNHENALKYCDMALEIDEDFEDAVRQKAMIASSLKDRDMMSDCADRLLKLYDDDIYKVMIPFMLKLFSGRYKDCLDIVNGVNVLDDSQDEMFKGAIYKSMVEDLNIEIRTSAPIEMTVDEVLDLFFRYHYDGIKHGEINGARYLIVKRK